jgi:HlyD family secretion protein
MAMNKKWVFVALASLLIVTGIYHFKFSNQNREQDIVTLKRGSVEEKVIAVGNIVPKHAISVKSTIPGIVGTLFHEEGDYVEQGALLLQVTPSPTPQSMAESHADVKEHLAITEQAKEHKKRLEQLLKLNIETPDNYALAVKDLATASAKLEMSQQKLALLQNGEATIAGKNIKTTVVSPISGYILARNVDVGDPVVPLTDAQQGTVLFVIANMQDLIFKGIVNEIDVAKISSNMPVNISIAALPDLKVKAVLSKISLQSNTTDTSRDSSSSANTNNPFNVGFNVELNALQLPKNFKLRAGYSATAEITIKHVQNVLTLPERVLIFKDDKTYVNLPDKSGKAFKPQEIKLGASDGINVEVMAGLSEGEKVLDIMTVPS